MTNPRMDVGGRDPEGAGSQLLMAVVAAAIVLLIGLLVALATAPGGTASSPPGTPVTSSVPVPTLSSLAG